MPALVIIPADLQLFDPKLDDDKAQALIDMAIARAVRFAPCIVSDTFVSDTAAKAIIVDAILRRPLPGARVQTAQIGSGSWTYDTAPRVLFQPADIAELQAMCTASSTTTVALPLYSFPDARA